MKRTNLLNAAALLILTFSTATMAVELTISNIDPAAYTIQYNSLASNQLVYIDRETMTYSSVPSTYQNKTYIRTANNDKYNASDSFLTFTIDQNCTIYVAHDDRITSKPSWLSSFTDTTENLVIDGNVHSLYEKDFNAGTVSLGGNAGGVSSSMYSVVVVPIYTTAPDPAENPSPTNNETGVPSHEANLSWTAGASAASHDIYFGQSNPPAFVGNQADTTYNPGRLANDTTYYWQINEVNAYGTTIGAVWNFTTALTTATGYWPMDDNEANSTVTDIAGTFNGTFNDATGNPFTDAHHTENSQKGTGALIFDGIDDYIVVPRNSVLETGHVTKHHLSASAWIKDESGGVGEWGTVVGTGDGGWVLARNSNNSMLAGFWLSSGGLVTTVNSTNINDGEWHHVVTVYDGSAVHLYVDETHTVSSTLGGAIQNQANKGVLIGENAGATGRYWNGLIDDVKIYDYALSSEDVYHIRHPEDAWNPSPLDGSGITNVTSNLSWLAGQSALSHNVYFGTSESAVINAQRLAGDINGDGPVDIVDLSILVSQWLSNHGVINPSADIEFNEKTDFGDFAEVAATWQGTPDSIFKGNQFDTTYDPGLLTEGVTYYWRIDEVNPSEPESPRTGRVWNFRATSLVRIMPLGDSITQGITPGGYRYFLWDKLKNAGYNDIDFVGSLTSSDSLDYDKNHNGYWGQSAEFISANINTYLNNDPPDVILLHIGTNGVEDIPVDVVEEILNKIDSFENSTGRSITVILAKIINRRTDLVTNPDQITNTTIYNNGLGVMAQARIDAGDNIIVVDMENGAGFEYTAVDMQDEKHPNTAGNQKMANLWFSALQTILP